MEGKYVHFREHDLEVQLETYDNGIGLAIELIDPKEGPYTRLTVNFGETCGYSILPPNAAFIDFNNCDRTGDLKEFLENEMHAEPYIRWGEPVVMESGFCEYPLYSFDQKFLEELDPVGWKKHCDIYSAHFPKIQEKLFDELFGER